MLNKELFVEDPSVAQLPNLGVAKIATPDSEQEWNTLRFELSHFVCDGAYESGLDRILGGYLGHIDLDQQPSVWVSGFYGSGKSHFLKVLQHLWLNTVLPDGSTARGLVPLPEQAGLSLRELTWWRDATAAPGPQRVPWEPARRVAPVWRSCASSSWPRGYRPPMRLPAWSCGCGRRASRSVCATTSPNGARTCRTSFATCTSPRCWPMPSWSRCPALLIPLRLFASFSKSSTPASRTSPTTSCWQWWTRSCRSLHQARAAALHPGGVG